jgi:hypothetical protein
MIYDGTNMPFIIDYADDKTWMKVQWNEETLAAASS